jgi:predicted DNA-binding mobile mystery protein A
MKSQILARHARESLDARLSTFRVAEAVAPRSGWLRAIRDALNMTTREMASRLEVSHAAVSSLERSERLGTIRLDTLRRAADALDCDLVYVLVPRHGLETTVQRAASQKAAARIGAVDRTMRLEAQGVSTSKLDDRIAIEATRLIEAGRVWDDGSR